MSADRLTAALAAADAGLDAAKERLFELLRIPSVSTEAAHSADCRRAAQWLSDELASLGLKSSVVDVEEAPGGHPLVIARSDVGAPVRALFYGHYDVQPVDPLELWETPPFEPQIVDGPKGPEIRARGASDDKGQVMTFVEALRAWRAAGGAPIDVTILLEGEEEAGGEALTAFLKRDEAKTRLAADFGLVCDTGLWLGGRPAITTQLRGMVAGEVVVRGPSMDLHSGLFGGPAANPLRVLSRLLAGLHDETGRVTLPGFYDDVDEPSEAVRASWRSLDFDASTFLGEVGLAAPAGEADRTALEQAWSRPTAEINGVIGGYTGDGFKTVIPSEARAKVSFRLVSRQDPTAVWSSFEAYARAAMPSDCVVELTSIGGSPAIEIAVDRGPVRAAAAALTAEWRAPTAFVGVGGSIPAIAEFKQRLGLDSVLVGFAEDDDRMHSPNEKYGVRNFEKGVRSWVRILGELGDG